MGWTSVEIAAACGRVRAGAGGMRTGGLCDWALVATPVTDETHPIIGEVSFSNRLSLSSHNATLKRKHNTSSSQALVQVLVEAGFRSIRHCLACARPGHDVSFAWNLFVESDV